MGYNTTVVVHNDSLEAIASDKEFGKKLRDAVLHASIETPVSVGALGHVNAAEVIESHHADQMHMVMVGGNIGYDLGYATGDWFDPKDPEAVKVALNGVARRHGLKVIKDTKRKVKAHD